MIFQFSDGEFSDQIATSLKMLKKSIVLVSVLRSWEKHFTLTVPLSTQVYTWVVMTLKDPNKPHLCLLKAH